MFSFLPRSVPLCLSWNICRVKTDLHRCPGPLRSWHQAHAPLADLTPCSPAPTEAQGGRRSWRSSPEPLQRREAGASETTCEPRLQAPSARLTVPPDLTTRQKSKVKFAKNVEMWPESIKHQARGLILCSVTGYMPMRLPLTWKRNTIIIPIGPMRKLKHREDN